ncbi:hypothetical protein EE612_057252, partial [Oryza sativa]
NETVMAHDVQTAAVSSFDLKGIEKHVESLHDAMELDGTESSKNEPHCRFYRSLIF